MPECLYLVYFRIFWETTRVTGQKAKGDKKLGRSEMRAEIVTIGSELLLGQIVDSNAAFIARELAAIGLDLHFKTTVGDNLNRLTDALKLALSRSEVVITTGGIGPTADDMTREAVALATGRPLEFSPRLMADIEAFFQTRGLGLSPSNQKQAYRSEERRVGKECRL